MSRKNEPAREVERPPGAGVAAPDPAHVNDWGLLQFQLDDITDIRRKIAFLQQVLSMNQHVCVGDDACPIFGEVLGLRGLLASMSEPDLDHIHEIQNQRERSEAQQRYDDASYQCDVVLQRIMAQASRKRNKWLDERSGIEFRTQMMERIIAAYAKTGTVITPDTTDTIMRSLNEHSSVLDWDRVKREGPAASNTPLRKPAKPATGGETA